MVTGNSISDEFAFILQATVSVLGTGGGVIGSAGFRLNVGIWIANSHDSCLKFL